ncbi:MAG: beta strand repeat-containing protein, partial [Rhizomicrobium sp.]
MEKNRNFLTALRNGKRGIASRAIAIVAMHGLCANAYAANVLPTGGQYVAGSGAISTASKGVVVNQSSKTGIVNWQGFSIGSGNTVQFNNGSGATLNRVTGGNLSQIDGMLKATGSVYLINPQGIVVGAGGKIITNGSFVGSTRDVSDDDFTKGKALRAKGTSSGAVVNKGTITSLYGDTILVGSSVSNSGSISAPNGTAGLAAGNDVTLRPAGSDPRIAVSAGKGDVTNSGTVAAAQAELASAGGNVYALAGNNGGLVSATGTKTVDGHVWLSSSGTTEISGTVKAVNANGTGGTVIATGKDARVDSTARVSASGTRGGTVLIGGDQRGGSDPALKHVSADVANAQTTTVANGAQISANGTQDAGGAVVIWSDDHTIFDGSISATGVNGNGGDAEVSGHELLDFTGLVDLKSKYADIGTLLLDPNNLTITGSGTDNTTSTSGGGTTTLTANATTSNLKASTITGLLGTTNVSVVASGTIKVNATINWTSNNSLTLDAGSSLTIGSGSAGSITNTTSTTATLTLKSGGAITQSGSSNLIKIANLLILPDASTVQSVTLTNNNIVGKLAANVASLNFKNNGALTIATINGTNGITATGGLTLNVNSTISDPSSTINVGTFTLSNGNWSQSSASLPSFTAGNFVLSGGTFLRVKGGDGATTPYQIADIYGLQGMIGFTGSNFSLANDIDASTTSGWNGGTGFVSLTINDGQTFDGQNHSINGLTINRSGWSVGLFDYNYGTIQNLTLHGGSVTDGGGIGAGALAGGNYGTISNVHSDLAVGGADGSDNTNYLQQAGGLVGYNTATGIISNSSASGNVSGYNQLGGLVGNNYGQITNSSASGSVTPGALYFTPADAGGLVGRNEGGTIDGGVASGDVIGQLVAGYTNLGGLVGTNIGTIKNSHASGNVTGDATAGGLVGSNGGYSNGVPATGSIDNSYYELGTVTGYDDTGGLVGANGDYSSIYGGTITNSYVASTATVTGTRDAGGLVGSNYGTGTVSGSHSGAVVNADVGNSGDQIYEIGGLTGRNNGSVTDSYATGAVNAGNESYYVGGLTGSSYGTMTNVYATGAVAGGSYVGGLAGDVGGTITTAHATGTVTVYSGTGGGFAGIVETEVTDAYATGDVIAADASLTLYGYAPGGLGGFVSINSGTISNAYASGNVIAGDGSDGINYGSSVGGFAASNSGLIKLSHATGNVTGFTDVGGFVGSNGGVVTQSYATGNVTAGLWGYEPVAAGGFAGENSGGITLSYATGDVSSPSNDPNGAYDFGVGGLVGYNQGGTISQSYATGNASGTLAVGGLVGYMQGGSVTDAYATGSVTGLGMVGGLIGENELATITNTYATGAVSGSYDTGALVGANGEYGDSYSGYGPGTISNSYWETDTAGGLPGVGYDTGSSTSVIGLSAAQMQDSSNFAGFDFNNIWSPAGNGYAPELYGASYVVRVDTAGSYQYGDPIQSTFYGLQNGDL